MSTVRVWIDGDQREVPQRVGSWAALRAALGVPDGLAVAVKGRVDLDGILGEVDAWAILGFDEKDVPGEVPRCWTFTEGEEYKTIEPELEDDEDEDRQPWQDDPEAWKE